MAYKRRRVEETSSSKSHVLGKARSSFRRSLITRRFPSSTPSLPPLPRRRVSLKSSSLRGSVSSPYREQDVIRANVIAENVETEADVSTREDSDAIHETILAVDMRGRGTLGCAYFVAREEKLYMMEDIKLAGLEIIDDVKLHSQPTVILISTRSDEQLEEYLKADARKIERGDEVSKCDTTLRNTEQENG